MNLSEKLQELQKTREKRQELWDKRFDFMYKSVMYIILTGWTFLILAAVKNLFS